VTYLSWPEEQICRGALGHVWTRIVPVVGLRLPPVTGYIFALRVVRGLAHNLALGGFGLVTSIISCRKR
jgi:hypothetical protein